MSLRCEEGANERTKQGVKIMNNGGPSRRWKACKTASLEGEKDVCGGGGGEKSFSWRDVIRGKVS